MNPARRLVDADHLEELNCPLVGGCLRLVLCVKLKRLAELPADREYRVQRGHRVLEDDGALVATEIFHFLFAELQDIASLIQNLTVDHFAGVRQNLHDRICRDRLAGTRLPDHAENFALLEVEGDAVDGLYLAGICKEGGMEILDFEDVALLVLFHFLPDLLFCCCIHCCHFYTLSKVISSQCQPLSFGSNASRSASPSRLNARQIRMIATAGKTSFHG